MSIDFNSYSSKFLPYEYIIPSSKSKYGIEAEAFRQLGQMLLNKSISSNNIQSPRTESDVDEEKVKLIMEKALKTIKEKERLEKICDQFLG